MLDQILQLCKSSFYHLRKIARIRSYLTPETAKLLLHAFVTSKLDYCNSLLYGVPKYQILRLQRIQNVAARSVNKHTQISCKTLLFTSELLTQMHRETHCRVMLDQISDIVTVTRMQNLNVEYKT